MSTSIEHIALDTDGRMVLANSSAARVLSIGSNWNRLRIGFRLAFDDIGGNVATSPKIWMGLLSAPSAGVANGPLGTATSHFVGIVSASTSFARQTTTTIKYNWTSTTGFQTCKKIGSTQTNGTVNFPGTARYVSATPATVRGAIFLEFTKGSPWVIGGAFHTGTGLMSDVSLAQMYQVLEVNDLAASVAYLPTGYTQSSVNGPSVDEATDGYLDAICVAWDRTTPALHISEMLYTKLD